MNYSEDALQWRCTTVKMHYSEDVLQWRCTTVKMNYSEDALQWRRTRYVFVSPLAPHPHWGSLHCTDRVGKTWIAPHCSVVHFSVVHCIALPYSAMHNSALHCSVVHCTALHCTALPSPAPHSNAVHFIAPAPPKYRMLLQLGDLLGETLRIFPKVGSI